MRFKLDSLLIYSGGLAVALAVNLPAQITISRDYVLPCILVGYADVPVGYEDRLPGSSSGSGAIQRRPLNEIRLARNMDVRRGWPLAYQLDRGFFYDLGDGRTWFGIPDSQPASLLMRLSFNSLTANLLAILASTIMLHRLWRRCGRATARHPAST